MSVGDRVTYRKVLLALYAFAVPSSLGAIVLLLRVGALLEGDGGAAAAPAQAARPASVGAQLEIAGGAAAPAQPPLPASIVMQLEREVFRKHRIRGYNMSHLGEKCPDEDGFCYGDLAPLPRDRSPESATWNNSIAICACMLQENSTDVREWLLYHRWLGVDHVYLTENSSPAPDYLVSQLQDFIDEGFLTLDALPRPWYQQPVYLECMKQHRHKHNWLAFIDLDEFIVLQTPGARLKPFLNQFRHEAGLVIHWVMFGPSGKEVRPVEGGVMRHYTHCNKMPHSVVKSIVNTWFLLNTGGNPHNFEYRDDRQPVDEHFRRMPFVAEVPQVCLATPLQDLDCRPLPATRKAWPRSVHHIAIFHYLTRSRQDFEVKMQRGGGGKLKRVPLVFDTMEQDCQDTGGVCDVLAKLADECCRVRKLTLPSP